MKVRTTAGRERRRGFSIIEAMLAFVVLLIAILGLIASETVGINFGAGGTSSIPMAFGDMRESSDVVQANTVAQQYMDALRYCVATRGSAYNNAALCPQYTAPTIAVDPGFTFFGGTSNSPAASLGNFNISGSCSNGGTGPLYTCTATVTWSDQGGATKTVTLTSQADDQQT